MQDESVEIETWEDLREATTANQGVYLTDMGVLKRIKKAGRLGNLVREEISNRLTGIGLGHLPSSLPAYQEQQVILYVKGGQVGKVVEAITGPPGEEAAEELRNLNSDTTQDKLLRIKEIIEE